MDLPVILGGERILDHTLNFSVPTLPPWQEVSDDLETMYSSRWLTKGPYLKRFEEKMRDMLQVKHAIGVSSCTAGLILALQSLHLEKGGEVIVPSFSFMATFHSIWWNGLKPVFVDCEPDTFTIDVEKVREAINEKTVAVAAVSVFGNPPDLQNLEKLCEEYHLPLFFDSAHGLGTFFRGEPLGGYGSFEVFSLSPTKLLTGGEGGLVTTNDDDIAAHVIAGRDYGNPGTYDCPYVGLNARMAEANAIIAAKGADYLEEYAIHRNLVAQTYREGLAELPGLVFQKIRENSRSSYKDFSMLVNEDFGISRDILSKNLVAERVANRAYFCPAGHELSCYKEYGEAKLPVTEEISRKIISLPISSDMDLEDVKKVCQIIYRLYEHRKEL